MKVSVELFQIFTFSYQCMLIKKTVIINCRKNPSGSYSIALAPLPPSVNFDLVLALYSYFLCASVNQKWRITHTQAVIKS